MAVTETRARGLSRRGRGAAVVLVAFVAVVVTLIPAWPARAAGARLAYLDNARRELLVLTEGRAPVVVAREEWSPYPHTNSLMSDPAWSPDGRAIAYGRVEYLDGGGQWGEIRVVDPDSGHSRVVVRLPVGIPQEVAWSPDGRRLAFSFLVVNYAAVAATWSSIGSRTDVYVVDIDGKNLRLLAPLHVGHAVSPTWSPDATTLALTSDVDGLPAIYAVEVDGTQPPRRLSPLGLAADQPAWSPDGRHVAFVGHTLPLGGTAKAWVVGADGRGVQEVADGVRDGLSWTHDGHAITFGSSSGIRTVAVPGGEVRHLTSGDDWRAVWSRAGTLAFVRDLGGWGGGECGIFVALPGAAPRRWGADCAPGSRLAWSPS